jgi:hypothetical protein
MLGLGTKTITRTEHPHTKKRSWKLLLLSIVSGIGAALLIYFVSPTSNYTIAWLQLTAVPLFFCLLFLFVYSLISYLFKSKVHGVLTALISVTYLLFRENSLTHPFFGLLLLALFFVLELLFTYRK